MYVVQCTGPNRLQIEGLTISIQNNTIIFPSSIITNALITLSAQMYNVYKALPGNMCLSSLILSLIFQRNFCTKTILANQISLSP